MNRQKKKVFYLFLVIVLCVGATPQVAFSRLLHDILRQQDEGSLKMVVGDLETIWARDLTRVAVANPTIADVVDAKPGEILVTAKKPGKSDLYIWDQYGKRNIVIWVFAENLELVQDRLVEILDHAHIQDIAITKNVLEGKLVLSGDLDEEEKDLYKSLLEPFQESVIDLVKIKEQRELVELDVQVAEVSTSHTETLGIEWTNDAGEGDYYFSEVLPGGNVQKFGDIFKIGKMARTATIQAKINALITQGKAKVLSKPKIVTKSGEEASFMVGGQIPVKTTTTSSGGNVTENIIFHDYGVTLKVKPLVTRSGKIDIDLSVDVSDIDGANAVGDTVAYTKRSAQTKLYLDNEQTIILAGFIKENKAVLSKRFPLLGSLPIVGMLFRSKTTTPDTETELFITLTPRVVARNEKKKSQRAQTQSQAPAMIRPPADLLPQSVQATEPVNTYAPVAVFGDMAFYARDLQERIAKNVVYPEAARAAKQQGTVELVLSVLKSGALISASVNKSSGHVILDEAALETVYRLSPYRAFPNESTLSNLTLTIPIVFQSQ